MQLIHTMRELVQMKEEYVKVQAALEAVRATGYGVVVPELKEIEIASPEVIRQGNKYRSQDTVRKSVYPYDQSEYRDRNRSYRRNVNSRQKI